MAATGFSQNPPVPIRCVYDRVTRRGLHYRRTDRHPRNRSMPGKSVKFAQRMKFGRCAPSCVCDGTYSNGANRETGVAASMRISAKFQNAAAVPSGQRRPVMPCGSGCRGGRMGLGRQFSQMPLEPGERVPAASRFPGTIAGKILGKIRRAALFCTTALAGSATWVPAFAADTNWTGAPSGNGCTATNWDTGAVPVLGDNAIIDTTTPNAAVLAAGAPPVDNLIVGNAATGMLTIARGGALSYGATGYLGFGAGSSGTVAVTGPGSSLFALHTLNVGNDGSGTLAVSNGGAMTGNDMRLGVNAGGTGTVTADGAGSQISLNNDLAVGYAGTGTLKVTNGAMVNASKGEIGQLAGSTGTATVDGSGSSWSNSNVLVVGNAGTGTLTISNGGSASGGINGIQGGESAGGIGTLNLTGAGSTLSNSPSLIVGNFGAGTLNIENGATAAISGPIILGNNAGSSGTATVTGAGSTLGTATNILWVGFGGTGALNIEGGAAVTAFLANFGAFAGSSGTVTGAGAGSSLAVGFGAAGGGGGAGTLAVLHGGTVTAQHPHT